jgi:hypothetical protein
VEVVPAHALQAHHRLAPRDQPRASLQAHLRICKPPCGYLLLLSRC